MQKTKASSAYDYPLIIKQLWHTPLALNPDQEIVSADNRRYSYQTLRERVTRLAGGLAAIGVGSNDIVAVMDWDNHRYLECFFAVPMMGAVLHTINIRLSPEQILYTINHAEDDVILVHVDFLPIIEQIMPRFERSIQLVYLDDNPAAPTPELCLIEYEAMLDSAGAEFIFPDFDENTTATTFYTTGTTGDPKGVYYSHRQLVLHTMAIMASFGSADSASRFHRGDVYMPLTPMFHVHGWGFPYAATLMGIKQVYPGRYEPARLLQLIEREGVTFSHCVPTIMHMLLSAPEADQIDLSRWKVIVGGAALPGGLTDTALTHGINIFAAYGLSETCPLLTSADMADIQQVTCDDESRERRMKTGQPTILVDLRVVDADMKDVVRDGKTTGEVVVRAPWLTRGYTGNSDASEALWKGGYLHTGDVGYIDDTGSLRITDRYKDVIKSGGEWLSSLELEDIVSRCEGVAEVAAFGIPDERWGERPMLAIVRSPPGTPQVTREQVQAVIRAEVDRGRLTKWAIPEFIDFVDFLPRTSVGKMDKKVLRAGYQRGSK